MSTRPAALAGAPAAVLQAEGRVDGAAELTGRLDGSARVAASWRWPLAALVLAWSGVLLLFSDTVVSMVTIWYRSGTFNHCFVVLPIALWLVWRQRYMLAPMCPRAQPWLLALVAATALAWLLGDLVAVNSVTQLAVVSMLVLAVPAILGTAVARAIAFPLGFLFFSVPIGEFLMPQLMESTADFTVAALRMSGIPVLREGLQFVIPSGRWSVVEACSGVRYLIASLTVGTLFAYLNYRSTRRRLLFVLVSLLVPIIANWMRAYMIVMLGHLSGNTLAVGVDHLVYGWVFFGVVVLLMFVIGARWAEPEGSMRPSVGLTPAPAAAADAPVRVALVLLGFLLLVFAPHLADGAIQRNLAKATPVLVAPAALSPAWQREPSAARDFAPAFQNPSASWNESYRAGNRVVGLYVGYYRNQDYERKLVSSENVLVTSSDRDWSVVRQAVRPVAVGVGPLRVRASELRRFGVGAVGESQRLTVWQLYWVDGVWTSNDYAAKLHGAYKRLVGGRDESAVIVVYADRADPAAAEAALTAFLDANLGALQALLEQTRDAR